MTPPPFPLTGTVVPFAITDKYQQCKIINLKKSALTREAPTRQPGDSPHQQGGGNIVVKIKVISSRLNTARTEISFPVQQIDNRTGSKEESPRDEQNREE